MKCCSRIPTFQRTSLPLGHRGSGREEKGEDGGSEVL